MSHNPSETSSVITASVTAVVRLFAQYRRKLSCFKQLYIRATNLIILTWSFTNEPNTPTYHHLGYRGVMSSCMLVFAQNYQRGLLHFNYTEKEENKVKMK